MFMQCFLEIKFADIRLISLEHVTYIYIYIYIYIRIHIYIYIYKHILIYTYIILKAAYVAYSTAKDSLKEQCS